jgi:hypothetical protein
VLLVCVSPDGPPRTIWFCVLQMLPPTTAASTKPAGKSQGKMNYRKGEVVAVSGFISGAR